MAVRRVRRRVNKRGKVLLIIIFLVIIAIIILGYFKYSNDNKTKLENKLKDIKKHYSEYVVTNKEIDLYDKEYKKVGKIGEKEEITLDEIKIDSNTEYFKIKDLDNEYYVYYKDVSKIDKLTERTKRYKRYIPFNENIITNNETSFYDEDNKLVYKLNKSIDMAIIIKDSDRYGVIYNDRLLYIKKDDVKETKSSDNTKEANTKGIAVLNYHFFYDGNSREDSNKCTQIICLSTQNLKKQLDYIKDNNIFTPTMKELEMYIDKKLNLPKSVVLTIDDGWRADIGSNIMAEYKLNGTVFLITNDYYKGAYENDYIEVHSHSHNLHKQGACSTGQGGGIQCLDKDTLLKDLKTSREKLNNTTVFCYPFYEYNNYSIQVLKEAGFTMAFGGPNENGYYKVAPGIDKFKLPRYVIYINTTVEQIKSYIG